MTDFSTYQPPGVYIEEGQTPLVSTASSAPAVLALVGPTIGYQTGLQAVTLTGEVAATLEQAGIDSANVEVTLDNSTTVDPGEYVIAQTGSGTAKVTTVKRTADSEIPDGDQVTVSYRYVDANFGVAKRFRDFDDVKASYGDPFDLDSGEISSPLSLAAQVAFDSGASDIICVASEGSATAVTRAQLNTAYGMLEGVYAANVIVPLPVGITGTDVSPGDLINVGTDLRNFCNTSSADRQYRTGLIGYEKTVTKDPVSIAAGIDSKRVGLVWPNRWNVNNSTTGQLVEVGGLYAAAAVGGRQVSLEPPISLTRKELSGFAGVPGDLRVSMTSAVRNAWSAGGVMVVEADRNGALLIRHGLSTDPTSVYTRELSLTRCKDRMLQIIQDTLDASGLIGSPIDDEMPVRLKGVVAGCMETSLSLGLVANYQNLKVRQRSTDPTVMEVKFEYLPPFPTNYIVVAFSINIENNSLLDLAA